MPKNPGLENQGLIKPDAEMLTYSDYLKVDELLSLQQPLAHPAEHDEMLFIVIHQVYELWFKEILHELEACCRFLDQDRLMRVMAGIKRIDAIQKVMTHQIDVLETMAPDDFARFRDRLNPASGFQSYQFRVFEFRMGLKNPEYLAFYQANQSHLALLQGALQAPTLYDHYLRFLSRRRQPVPAAVLARDFAQPYEPNKAIEDIYCGIYEAPYENADIYLSLEALLDLDQNLSLWRFRHKSMVERIIGQHRGTGGSAGAAYLGKTLAKRCFPEIWTVRNRMGMPV